MSFTSDSQGRGFRAGHFLVDDEGCVRRTMTISAEHASAVTSGGRTIVPAGSPIPSDSAYAVGILYEDVDVTNGDAPGSVIVEGTISSSVTTSISAAALTALNGAGVRLESSNNVTRPY